MRVGAPLNATWRSAQRGLCLAKPNQNTQKARMRRDLVSLTLSRRSRRAPIERRGDRAAESFGVSFCAGRRVTCSARTQSYTFVNARVSNALSYWVKGRSLDFLQGACWPNSMQSHSILFTSSFPTNLSCCHLWMKWQFLCFIYLLVLFKYLIVNANRKR